MSIADIRDWSLEQIQNEVARRQGAILLSNLQRLEEAYSVWDNYVDPREPYWDDPNGEPWYSAQGADPDDLSSGFENEELLREARRICRVLCMENCFAISGMENRVNYVVGCGHRYQVTPRDTEEVPGSVKRLIQEIQEVVDEFVLLNDWYTRQAENQRREDRDGEAFLRLFPDFREGVLLVRTLEPGLLAPPNSNTDSTFGIQTLPNDVETVVGYWLEGEEFIPADLVQHRRANVDKNVKRGVPTFWPVRNNLDRAYKLLRNMSVVTTTQASIAMIRKINSASADGFAAFRQSLEDRTRSSERTGRVQSQEDFTTPGRIINARGDVDYEFPIVGVNAGGFVEVLDAELRAIGSRLCMPEWMLAGNARNNNMASSIVAGSPAYRMFERLQNETKEYDREILWRAIGVAIAAGRLRGYTLAQIQRLVEIEAVAPDIENLDPLARTQKNQTLKQEGVLSVKTWSQKEGLDYDTEQQNRQEHQDRYGDLDAQGLPLESETEQGQEGGDET